MANAVRFSLIHAIAGRTGDVASAPSLHTRTTTEQDARAHT